MRPQIISFRCKILNQLGKVLSVSYNEEVINQLGGGGDRRLTHLIEGLQAVSKGEKRKISVPAQLAYGPYDPSLLVKVDSKTFPLGKQCTLGSQVIYPHSKSKDARVYRIVEKTPEYVVMDGNHPFAGIDLVYEIEITSARRAKREDLLQYNDKWLSENIH